MIEESQHKFKELKDMYSLHLKKAKNEYDYYNLIEGALLAMEEDSDLKKVTEEDLKKNDLNKEDL